MNASNVKAKLAAALKSAEGIVELLKVDDEYLTEPLAFSIVSDDSDPHRVHVLDVVIDNHGIRIETIEDNRSDRERFVWTWDDLVSIASKSKLIEELDAEIADKEASLRDAGAHTTIRFTRKLS